MKKALAIIAVLFLTACTVTIRERNPYTKKERAQISHWMDMMCEGKLTPTAVANLIDDLKYHRK